MEKRIIKNSKDFYTTKELFDDILRMVRERGNAADEIDYAVPRTAVPIYSYHFDPAFVLHRGTNEGLILELAISGYITNHDKRESVDLGIIKTLNEKEEGIYKMSKLYAECFIAYDKIVDQNLDAITRIGYDLGLYTEDNRRALGYSGFATKEDALERWQTVSKKYPKYIKAIIRDNLTRKETVCERL